MVFFSSLVKVYTTLGTLLLNTASADFTHEGITSEVSSAGVSESVTFKPETTFGYDTMHIITGVMGVDEGFITNQTQITEDNDGRFTDSYCNGLIDLTKIMSKHTGRQLSQMANYRIGFVELCLRNVNDAADNDNTMHVGGYLEYYQPHKKMIDCLQLLRQYMREDFSENSETKAIWESSDKNYRGLRFGWDANTLVAAVQTDGSSNAFSSNNLNLHEALSRYNSATGGFPAAEGYDDDSGQGTALWDFRTPITKNRLSFNIAYTNPDRDSDAYNTPASYQDWQYQSMYPAQVLKICGGLMALNLKHGNTDAAGFIEDEYEIVVTVGVEGWEEF